ncbi:unnamed protein product, partial [Ectocarpus sp. 12 AP-2014]
PNELLLPWGWTRTLAAAAAAAAVAHGTLAAGSLYPATWSGNVSSGHQRQCGGWPGPTDGRQERQRRRWRGGRLRPLLGMWEKVTAVQEEILKQITCE